MGEAATAGGNSSPPVRVPRGRVRGRWASALAFAGGVAAVAMAAGWDRGGAPGLPKRFAEIEPGLYRSGQPRAAELERVVREYGLRTVLRMNSMREDDPRLLEENEVLRRHGVASRFIPMNGKGTAPFEVLEEAAAVAADPSLRPLLFHCSAGHRRSGAVMAVYRLRYCGWTWERTAAELAAHGITPDDDPSLSAHLARYHRERILGRR